MALEEYKLKFSSRKGGGSLDSPQFSLSYRANNEAINSRASYEILSKLIGDNDVVIEVNSSLTNTTKTESEDRTFHFLSEVRNRALDYSYRKVPSSARQSFLSMIFGGGKKNAEAHEIMAYIPEKVWKEETFLSVLPVYGARYYVMKSPEEGDKVINELCRMLDSEKIDYFKLIVFDVASFGQMGIVSNYLTADDIKGTLGIK
ncbi:MAG: hypothetical protein ACOX7R_02015 [Acetivibrionales bacterium]|jgi:hypothetical protein